MKLIRGKVKIEWVELGEGLNGDYDAEDESDIELLRFDVSVKEGKKWVEVPDASYCTLFPVTASTAMKKKGLKFIMDEIHDEVEAGNSIKKLCERNSWISQNWTQGKK